MNEQEYQKILNEDVWKFLDGWYKTYGKPCTLTFIKLNDPRNNGGLCTVPNPIFGPGYDGRYGVVKLNNYADAIESPIWSTAMSSPFYDPPPPPMTQPVPPKQRRKNKKSIEEERARPPEKRVSYRGYCYPDSCEEEWVVRAPVGWVHSSELEKFEDKYILCISPNGYYPRNMVRHICSNGIASGYVETSLYDKSLYFECASTMTIVPIGEACDANNEEGHPIKISTRAAKNNFFRCDIAKALYPRHLAVSVTPNVKNLKSVCSLNMDGIVEQCLCCQRFFIVEDLAAHDDLEGDWHGAKVCDNCYTKKVNQGVIHKHDYKTDPVPITVDRVRRKGNVMVPVDYIRLFGVEVELEFDKPSLVKAGLDRFKMSRQVKNFMGKDFVDIKEDGSLTMNGKYNGAPEFDPDGTKNGKLYAGFEVVSKPACIDTHRARWAKLETMPEFPMLRAWDTETCGLHVHVSRDSLTLLQIGRMLAFVNHPSNRHFIRKVAGRSESKYCKNHNKRLSDTLHPEAGDHDTKRRVAINVQNAHTIEFRIFRGTVRPCHIIRNIEFVDAVCDYCYPASRAFRELFTPFGFIDFVLKSRTLGNKTWPILASWMIDSGLAASPSNKKKPAKSVSAPVSIPLFSIEKDIDTAPLKVGKSDWNALSIKSEAKQEAKF